MGGACCLDVTGGANEGAGGVMAFDAFRRAAPVSCFDCSAPLLAKTGAGGTSDLLAQHEADGCSSRSASLSVADDAVCMSPISIPSCDAAGAFPACMAQPDMSRMFGQNAAASTCPQPLTKSREMTQMRSSFFIESY
jgi:hypothetical protein